MREVCQGNKIAMLYIAPILSSKYISVALNTMHMYTAVHYGII